MEPIMLSPKSRTPRDKYTPSPRPFIHLKRRFNSLHSSPFTPPTPPKYRISWFHGRLARRNGHEITKATAARMSRKQLVDADWEKQKQELLEVAAEENALIEDDRLEANQDVQDLYDPNAEPSTPVPSWILSPKTPQIRKHAHSPLHQTPKTTASQIRKNLIRSPSRRHSKALVSEEFQSTATPTRSTNWKITPIRLTADSKIDELECEIRFMKTQMGALRGQLYDAVLRDKELEDVVQTSRYTDRIVSGSGQVSNSFFRKSLIWTWCLIPQTSQCYIIFHVLCYFATKLRPDSAH